MLIRSESCLKFLSFYRRQCSEILSLSYERPELTRKTGGGGSQGGEEWNLYCLQNVCDKIYP
jgi:hypothetical protein